MSRTIKNAIVLSSELGSLPPIYGLERDIPENHEITKARVDGSDSFYIVYDKPDFHDESDTNSSSYIVDTTENVKLEFTARSTQGWNKIGITVLEHAWYCGTGQTYQNSNPDITDAFPPGASSIIVMKGVWSLYCRKEYGGRKICINGEDEFGPGTRIHYLCDENDRVKSIRYVRDN